MSEHLTRSNLTNDQVVASTLLRQKRGETIISKSRGVRAFPYRRFIVACAQASSQATSARRKQEGRKKALMKKRVAQTARA